MNNRTFWKEIFTRFGAGNGIVLMYVAASEGSSPGRSGFKMAVDREGNMFGLIGGGIMEHKLVEYCKSLLTEGAFRPFVKLQIHRSGGSSDRSGMICSGEQTIAFYHLDQNWILTSGAQLNATDIIVYDQNGIRFESENTVDRDIPAAAGASVWRLHEKLGLSNRLYIIGAGHVGLALSEVIHRLDFELFLIDDRADLNTLQYNKFIAEANKTIIDYQKVETVIPEGENIYVVLVSFSFRTDELIIKQLLNKKLKYFGVMGSKSKMKVLIQNLLDQGFDKNRIEKINTPVGMQINSRTPQEIAISIAAQIIQIKNR